MASGSDIVGGAAAGAQILPGLFGRGKSQHNAQDISHSGMYDPFAYQFGNYGAENYAQGREQQANAIDRRSAPQANYMQADMDRQRALQARASQSTVMNQLMARAAGQTPSIAQMQADRQMGQASAQQAALQASARGRGALANAATTAASNTANAHGAISNQAQINAANERLQAEQAAFGAASGMRGQDYQSQNQAAQQAQYQAGLQLGSRQTNDARAVQTQQMGHQAIGQEQQGRVQQQAIAAQSHANAQNANQRTEAQNANNKGLLDTVGDWFSSDRRTKYITSDFTAKHSLQGTPLPSLVGGGGMTTSTWGGGGTNPMSGAADASFDKLSGDGMDVMGSLEKHSNFATKFQGDPTNGMTGGAFGSADMMLSDARAKREAFEAGAAYADAEHAGKPIAPPAYAVQKDEKRGPQIGAKIGDAAKGAKPEDARTLHDAAVAAGGAVSPVAAPYQVLYGPAAQSVAAVKDSTPAQRAAGGQPAIEAAKAMGTLASGPIAGPLIQRSFGSDFTTKEPLRGGRGLTRDTFGNPADGDPNAPQMGFDPVRGWFNPDAPQRPDLNAAIDEQAARDAEDIDVERRVAEQRRKDAAAMAAREAWSDEPKASDGRQMAPGTADFQKTGPKPEEGGNGTKPWWEVLGAAGKSLNEAQFGHAPSDRRAKNVIDLDASEPGSDASRMRDGSSDARTNSFDKTFRRDTPADQKRVRRAVEDKAGRDADAMMAGMRASLGKGSAVDDRIAASLKPSDSPVAEANRTMRGEMYTYKPQFTPPEQKPGEPNFGFMAQNLEKSPITATAVKEDPNGLKRVDALKLLRVLGASVADLQQQQDETRLALKGGKKGNKR